MPEQRRTIRSSKELGAFIHDARKQRNLTQETLAEQANVSRSWLIGLEQGKRPRAEIDKILSLLHALGISLNLHMTHAPESVSENQALRSDSITTRYQSTPSQPPQAPRQNTDPAPWHSMVGEVFQVATTPYLNTIQRLNADFAAQAMQPLLRSVHHSVGDALRVNIPNFGQASGISQALNRKEQKNKTTDSE